MSEHTQTPWAIDPCSDETIAICTEDGSLHIATLEVRADEHDIAYDNECFRECDAEFIVQAVNAHDSLVAACQSALKYLRGLRHSDMDVEEEIVYALMRAGATK